jgi:hypothetical protein
MINDNNNNKPLNQLYRKRDKSRFDFANKNNICNIDNNIEKEKENKKEKLKLKEEEENNNTNNNNNIKNTFNNNNNNKNSYKDYSTNLNISKIILINDEDLNQNQNQNLNKPKKITLNSIINNNIKDLNINNKTKLKKLELNEKETEKEKHNNNNNNNDNNPILLQKYKKINLIPNIINLEKENIKEYGNNEELVPDYVSDVIRKKISRHTFFKKFENVFFNENEDNDYLHFEKELNRNDSWSQFIVSNLVKTIKLTNEV